MSADMRARQFTRVREGLATDSEDLRAFGDVEAERLQTGHAHNLARMRRVLHGHVDSPFVKDENL